jgi:hypothetical protein
MEERRRKKKEREEEREVPGARASNSSFHPVKIGG